MLTEKHKNVRRLVMSTKKQRKKYLSLLTYCIALICLILGLLLPVFDGKMLCTMLPDALSNVFGLNIELGNELSLSASINVAGYTYSHLADVVVLLYALVTVLGIILFIPALASKKTTKTAAACAYFVEILALIVLFVFALIDIENYTEQIASGNEAVLHWSVTALAFGGTFLMLVIQSIGNKGSSGFIKFITALLGLVSVGALLDIVNLLSLTTTTIESIGLSVGFIGTESGLSFITDFMASGIAEMGTAEIIASIALFAALILAIVNFVLAIIGLGTNTSKGVLVFGTIRYLIEFVAIIGGTVLFVVYKFNETGPGLLMYVVLAATVLLTIISLLRTVAFKSEKRKEEVTVPEADYYYDDTTPVSASAPAASAPYVQQPAQPQVPPIYIAPVPMYQPAPPPAPAYAPAPATHIKSSQTHEVVYTAKEVYRGPTDAFISRLTDSEKIEFVKLFLEKVNGPYVNIPDYIIGGDNKDFFASIFIYLGKFRSLLSDGLMNKIYNELNLLN